jgi:hypothetical protein
VRKNVISSIMTAGALGVALLLAYAPAQSQAPADGKGAPNAKAGGKGKGGGGRGAPAVQGPTPKTADGKVDFSGLYNSAGPVGDIAARNILAPGEEIVMTDWAAGVMKSRQSKDDPEANCLPTGVPRASPYPWRIVQTPTHIFFLFEGNIHSYRQIFIDGRKHDPDPDPTWYGDSVGTWDGDSMVVDTIGYNDKFWFDFAGHPHTTQLHTIERMTRPGLGTVDFEVQIIDPGAYKKPFKLKYSARLMPRGELTEYICQENQQDAAHLVGGAGLN